MLQITAKFDELTPATAASLENEVGFTSPEAFYHAIFPADRENIVQSWIEKKERLSKHLFKHMSRDILGIRET